MTQKVYIAYNAASPTTAAMVKVATGTAIKTLLQVGVPSTTPVTVVEWGISFDGSAAATPGVCELIDSGTVAATSGTGLTPTLYGDPNAVASLCVSGTGATCFSPSAEGSITTVRVLDTVLLPPTAPYFKQFPLGREPQIKAGDFLRVRVTFGTTVNALCWIVWEE